MQCIGKKGSAGHAESRQLLAYQIKWYGLVEPVEALHRLHFFLKLQNKIPQLFLITYVVYRLHIKFN